MITFRTVIIQSIICDLSFFVEEANTMCHADDNSPHVCSENADVTRKN